MPEPANPEILLVEPSATLRRLLVKHLERSGRRYEAVAEYGSAGARLRQPPEGGWIAAILGWPEHTDAAADELLALLEDEAFRPVATLVLATRHEPALLQWCAQRHASAFLTWDEHAEVEHTLGRLVRATAPVSPEVPVHPRQDALQVLFVDDAPSARAGFRRLLEAEGYRVTTASSVQEGWTLALCQPFDLAIVDYFMPEATGDQLCRRLREDPRTAGITCAVITAAYVDRVIQDSIAAGAVECMFKNESHELLLARIDAIGRSVQAHRAIGAERELLRAVLGAVGEGVYGVDALGAVRFVNAAALGLLGWEDEADLIGRSAHEFLHPVGADGSAVAETDCELSRAYRNGDRLRERCGVMRHGNGVPVPVVYSVNPMKAAGSVVAFRRVEQPASPAFDPRSGPRYDDVTELMPRAPFEEVVEDELNRLRRSREHSAMLYIDIDDMQGINEQVGHDAGDELLREVARLLKSRLRDTDVLARIQDDEFAILLRNVSLYNIFYVADGFRELVEPFSSEHDGVRASARVSIGVAVLNRYTRAAADAVQDAQVASAIAYRKGGNRTHLYRSERDENTAEQEALDWAARIHRALEHDGFALRYQPVLRLDDLDLDAMDAPDGAAWEWWRREPRGTIFEVLLRLADDDGTLSLPDGFLPMAERHALLQEVDIWVLGHALTALAGANARDSLSVNLSMQALHDPYLLRYLCGQMDDLNIAPARVILEIPEAALLGSLQAARRFVHDLKSLGCRIALDQFGSGLHSFSYLKQLPVDLIKVSPALVHGIGRDDPIDRAALSALCEVAATLQMHTVAKQVETRAQLHALRQCGVDYAQGLHLAAPLEALSNGASRPAVADDGLNP